MRTPTLPVLLLALALTGLAACASTSGSLERLAREQREAMLERAHSGDEARANERRAHERGARVCDLVADEQDLKAGDHLHAALVLVQCNDEAYLERAQQHGLAAAELGDNRGFRVAAEAQDKLLMKRGMMQRFGTQFVWEPVLRAWRLYATDPRTTDEERKAMGVPSLAQLLEQEKALNAPPKSGVGAR